MVFGKVLGGQNPRFSHFFLHFFEAIFRETQNAPKKRPRAKNGPNIAPKNPPSAFLGPLGSIFCSSRARFKNDFEKTSKKVRKSRILASQNPPKTSPKSSQNRCPKKHAIFRRFLFEKCSVAKMPTSIPYWFLQYKMALGRFSSSCFWHGFGPQKTIQKPLENRARATQKSISKTCCFLTSIFSRFGLDFGASWASKMEPSPPRCLQRQAC